jgi:hypothetical protein
MLKVIKILYDLIASFLYHILSHLVNKKTYQIIHDESFAFIILLIRFVAGIQFQPFNT